MSNLTTSAYERYQLYCQNPTDRINLIAEVAVACLDNSESWDPARGGHGVQLAYLLASIADPSWGDYQELCDDEPTASFCRWLRELFAPEHAVWLFVKQDSAEVKQ